MGFLDPKPAPLNWIIAQINTVGSAIRNALDAIFVRKGDLVLNIYDYGAVNSSSTSSQEAADAVLSVAANRAAGGARTTIRIPYGFIRADFNVSNMYVSFEGPGNLVGKIKYAPSPVGSLWRFYSKVNNLSFINPAGTQDSGIEITAGANIEIASCTFNGSLYGILLKGWDNVTGQQTKTIHAHHNTFIDVDYAFRGTKPAGGTWDCFADCTFEFNLVRVAYKSAILLDGVDGVLVHGNTFFAAGYNGTDPRKLEKGDTITFGVQSSWIQISHNQIFEAGGAGINLHQTRPFSVIGNSIIWSGQVTQQAGIKVTTISTLGEPVSGTIIGNVIDGGTQHGIAIEGNGLAGNIVIESNTVRLYKTTNVPCWIGTGSPVTNNIARVHVGPSVTDYPQISAPSSVGSRDGVVSVKGIYSLARRQTGPDSTLTSINVTKTVAANTAVTLGLVRGITSTLSHAVLSGELTITVRNWQGNPPGTGTPRVGVYRLMVEGFTKQVLQMGAAGLNGASADGANPAFSFTMSGTGDLIATPVNPGSGTPTQGTFVFSVVADGGVQVGFTVADFNALALAN